MPDALAEHRADLQCDTGEFHGGFLEFLFMENQEAARSDGPNGGGSGELSISAISPNAAPESI